MFASARPDDCEDVVNIDGMRVLLATDGSEQALAATDWLLAFPLPRSTTVRVFAVAALASVLPGEPESARQDRRRLYEHAGRIGE